jgi:methionyl-tRNA formyltransferase
MKKTSKTVVFFGSGPVAAKSLSLLLEHTDVEAVITKPRPSHHKEEPPVLEIAKKHNLPHHTPKNKKELTALFTSVQFSSPAGLVIDYGIIIEKAVIDYFPMGIVNSHFSLLPQWRGPDPITFAILSGQSTTGISLMCIDEELDEGPLIGQAPLEIPKNINGPQLTEKLIQLSDAALGALLEDYLNENIEPIPQEVATIAPTAIPSYSHLLKKSDGIIDWQKPAEQIEREVRAFIGWPKSSTRIANKDVVITKTEVVNQSGSPGKPSIQNKHELIIYCGKKALRILKLKPAGKKEMSAEAFLAGHKNQLD